MLSICLIARKSIGCKHVFKCFAERGSVLLRVWKLWHEALLLALAFAQYQIQLSRWGGWGWGWGGQTDPFPSLKEGNVKDVTSCPHWELLSPGSLPKLSPKENDHSIEKRGNREKSLRNTDSQISDQGGRLPCWVWSPLLTFTINPIFGAPLIQYLGRAERDLLLYWWENKQVFLLCYGAFPWSSWSTGESCRIWQSEYKKTGIMSSDTITMTACTVRVRLYAWACMFLCRRAAFVTQSQNLFY